MLSLVADILVIDFNDLAVYVFGFHEVWVCECFMLYSSVIESLPVNQKVKAYQSASYHCKKMGNFISHYI